MDFARRKLKRSKQTKKGKLLYHILILAVGLILLSVVLLFIYLDSKSPGRTNVVFAGDSLVLASLDQERETLTLFKIPDNLYLEVAGGKGRIKAGSLFKFDQLQNKRGELLKSTIREFFGVPVDQVIEVKGIIADKQSFKKIPLFPLWLTRFYFQAMKIREDKIDFFDLGDSPFSKKEMLPDGSSVLTIEPVDLDSETSGKFYERKIMEENLSIAVLNGTEQNGLASRSSRIIDNIGGKVVIVGESSNETVDCSINLKRDDLSKTYTVRRLVKVFSCEIENKSLEESRADVTVTVGTVYRKEVTGI